MMTKNEFLNFLQSKLDFLDANEKKIVLDFFEEKLSACTTKQEENSLFEALRAEDSILEKMKIDLADTKNRSELKKYLVSIFDNAFCRPEKDQAESDVIFSRPIHVEKASKVIHSMDDHEVKTLFGEKVIIEGRGEPSDGGAIVEPIDEANGLTTQEIRIAKKKTLEKTEAFTGEPEKAPEEPVATQLPAETTIPLEEEDEAPAEPKSPKKVAEKTFSGLFHKIIPSEKYNKSTKIALLILLTIAVSPIIIAAFGLLLAIYASLVVFTGVAVGLFFGAMIASIAIAVVELVHGFLVLFDSVAAALIELGFGTVLFSFVVAIAALIYEFNFGIVPKWLKWITKIFVHYTKLLYCYLYGGKA